MKCSECEFGSVRTFPRNGNGNSATAGHFTADAFVCSHPSGAVVLFAGKTAPRNCPLRENQKNGR